MTEQTDKTLSKSIVPLIMLGILAGLFGLIGMPILLYWQLGKLEPNSLRQLACGSICLLPVIIMASNAYFIVLYKANRKGQDNALKFAGDAWSQVADGLFKASQARQPSSPRQSPPNVTLYPYPPYQLGPAQHGMIVEQRQVADQMYE